MRLHSIILCSILLGGCASAQRPESAPATQPVSRPAPSASPRPPVTQSQPLSLGERVTRDALRMVGTPYVYGGASPSGFDCSGLVYWAYRNAGVRLPRTSRDQQRTARAIDARSLRPGDLLFFDTPAKSGHVGIYIGNRKFVHAPSSGGHVSVVALDRGYYATRMIGAGRVLP